MLSQGPQFGIAISAHRPAMALNMVRAVTKSAADAWAHAGGGAKHGACGAADKLGRRKTNAAMRWFLGVFTSARKMATPPGDAVLGHFAFLRAAAIMEASRGRKVSTGQ